MKLGEKVRQLRLSLGLTQKDVVDGCITRSMLSEIESGVALPSIATLSHLAKRLHVSPGYLVDENRTLAEDAKYRLMPTLWQLFQDGKYDACIETAKDISAETDPDLSYLLACAHLHAAEDCVEGGSVNTALSHLQKVRQYASDSIYDTSHLLARAVLCSALASEPLTPKYALDKDTYNRLTSEAVGEELYHYLQDDWEYAYETQFYQAHMEAKKLMKERRYPDAIQKMTKIVDNRFSARVSVLLLYRVYSDLETCYRERENYEKAYQCSSKKNALLASFRN